MGLGSYGPFTKGIGGRSGVTVIGDKRLERKFNDLERRAARRVATKGVRAMTVPIVKALRAAVTATDTSSALKREARKTIGKKFRRVQGMPTARVGFGVGKKQMKTTKAGTGRTKFVAMERDERGRSKKGLRKEVAAKGVGISAANIHWFVLGTDKRFLTKGSAKGFKAGHPTGKIDPPFSDTMKQAVAANSGAALAAARAKISQEIRREAAKR